MHKQLARIVFRAITCRLTHREKIDNINLPNTNLYHFLNHVKNQQSPCLKPFNNRKSSKKDTQKGRIQYLDTRKQKTKPPKWKENKGETGMQFLLQERQRKGLDFQINWTVDKVDTLRKQTTFRGVVRLSPEFLRLQHDTSAVWEDAERSAIPTSDPAAVPLCSQYWFHSPTEIVMLLVMLGKSRPTLFSITWKV